MARFTLVVAKHDTEPNAARYDDFVRALGDTLRALGHEVTGLDRPGRLIMFNTGNMDDPAKQLPDDAILFNTEQIAAASFPRNMMTAYATHRKRVVWDYSKANAEVLRDALGMERVVLCSPGYVSSMTRIESISEEDVDVLFYGAVNARRTEILGAIESSGLTVKRLYGIYGTERDRWIARSKVVLNLHFGFERGAVFEIFRCSHLWANRKCVVTENGGLDRAIEALAMEGCVYVDKEKIVETCLRLCRGPVSQRRMYANRGFDMFSKIDFSIHVRRALEQS